MPLHDVIFALCVPLVIGRVESLKRSRRTEYIFIYISAIAYSMERNDTCSCPSLAELVNVYTMCCRPLKNLQSISESLYGMGLLPLRSKYVDVSPHSCTFVAGFLATSAIQQSIV